MKIEFINYESTDKLVMPSLLYSPDSNCDKVAIFLHGNGDSGVFYKQEMVDTLGKTLAESGISFFAMNNRGSRYKKKLVVADSGISGEEKQVQAGVHYELIKDCVNDIDGAISTLEDRGYKELYLIGFSTGANKICVYDKLSTNNKVSKYIHAGPGDDSGLFYNEIGEKYFWESLKYAKKMIDDGRPVKVMPKYTKMNPFSAQSAFDILDPNGLYNTFPYYEYTNKRLGTKILFSEYAKITKPMLVVFGENDEFTYTGGGTESVLNILKSKTNKTIIDESDFKIIKNTDHGFHGKEKELARQISEWLTK
jgi:pimeloyl-ACP methyl ester carboxylesterase